jgi:medium-chain acyl-[acyl-carrier-protein] hydrolase
VTSPAASTARVPRGLIRFGSAGSKSRRLFCLPFAGGGPSTYRMWPRSLPADVDVIAVQPPGRDPSAADPPADSIAEMVDTVLASITELHDTEPMPFSLFGHSMGALVAFEMTVALEEGGGTRPTRLFVSGRRPPDEAHHGDHVHALADDEFLDAVQRSYGGVPDVVRNEPELLALLLPSLRADIKAIETYAPFTGRMVDCPVRVYGGARDRNPRPSQLGGWQRVAARGVSIRLFEGDHFYLATSRDALTADIAEHV